MFGFNKQTPINTDTTKIDELLSRSVAAILPTKEGLTKKFLSGERLRIYIGADATGPDLHLGHSTNFFFLERMRRLGHEIIVLFGDFTAMIGDPTDKSVARVQLTKEEVEKNISTWEKQISHVLDLYNKENPVRIERNSTWLSKLTFSDVVDLASNFTVQQMIERDMFEKRISEGKPVYVHEFMYPLMVGYDSVVLDVDIELGGNDQTFNMLAGRTLQKVKGKRDKSVVATTLLVNPSTGKKLMSKSEGGYVSLQDTPQDMYGKVMALPDVVVRQLFIDATWVSLDEIESIMASQQDHPKETKMRLARELVTIYHSAKHAAQAEQNFEATFSKGGVPEDVEVLTVLPGSILIDVLVAHSVVSSKTDFRRLVKEGAVSVVEGEKVSDVNAQAVSGTYRIGKKRFVKIVV
jgi:tyrosyl-tRNA synthetase